jgi:hypothetical protein
MYHSSPQELESDYFSSTFLIAVGSKMSIINLTLYVLCAVCMYNGSQSVVISNINFQ